MKNRNRGEFFSIYFDESASIAKPHVLEKYSIFGIPLWFGKIKDRVAKKKLANSNILKRAKLKHFHDAGIGSVINACSGYNSVVTSLSGDYYGYAGGYILRDISIETENFGFCSFVNCGIENPKSKEEINKLSLEHHKCERNRGYEWLDKEKCDSIITLLESSGSLCDENGFKLDK
jgi:hypothetical protein